MNMLLGLTLAVFIATPLSAQDYVFVESKPVKDKPVLEMTPARAYILVRADDATSFMLFKDPDAKDQVEYDRLKAEAFAEEQERHAKRLARYERDMATYAKASASSRETKPEKPGELTKENFAFTPFPLLTRVPIGPMNRLSKANKQSVYLTAVTPGTYRLYGPVFAGPEGEMAGVCFCLGSVRFEAKAGEIVDMGRAVAPALTKPASGDSSSPITALNGSYRIQPASTDMPIDPRINGMTVRPAVYRPAGKLPNFFGLPISRLEAMPGVFAYDRDRIVDLTGGAASGAQ